MGIRDWARRLFNRADAEKPVPTASRIFSVGRTFSGVHVTADSALRSATVWACCRYLTSAVGQLPWNVMQTTPSGGSATVPSNPVDKLLNFRPCPDMGPSAWRASLLGNALLSGNGYAEIERDNRGAAYWLWPIHPSRVRVMRAADGGLEYEVANVTGGGSVVIPAADMFHVRGFGDGPVGYSVVEYAAQSIGWTQATEIFGATYFGEGMNPSGVVTQPAGKGLSLPGREELRKALDALYKGPRGKRTLILDAGMDFVKLGTNPNDAQFIETRQHQVDEICFAAGTEVITPWGPKAIEKIEVGERVLTHRGRWRRVTNVMSREYVGPMVTVTAKGLETVTATANHPFYALAVKKNRRGGTDVSEPQWVDAGMLAPGAWGASGNNRSRRAYHALTQPRLRHDAEIGTIDLAEWAPAGAAITDEAVRTSENHRATPCTRRVGLSYDFGWLCGLFAADGSTSERQTIFYLGAHECDLTEKLERRLAAVFGVYSGTAQTAGNVARTVVSHRVIATLFSDFGHAADEKGLPAWCMAGGADFRRGLIDGLVDGDGCVYGARTMLRTTSRRLVWQLRTLLWAEGIHGAVATAVEGAWEINGRTGTALPIHTVEWRPVRERPGSAIFSDDLVGFRLEQVETKIAAARVYNLEVEEDESYTTVGGCVHNCRWFGVPPHKVQHLLRATFSNIEHQSIEVVVDSVTPWVKAFEEEADYKLFGPVNRQGLFTKMNLRGLLRGDNVSRAQFYKSLNDMGALSINEIRALEDFDGIGPDGDKRFISVNLQSLKAAIAGPIQPVAPTEPAADPEQPPTKTNGAANGSGEHRHH